MNNAKHLIARWSIIVAVVLSTIGTFSPPKAQAQWSDFLNFVPNTISSISNVYQEVKSAYDSLKETVLDPLAWALAKMLLQSLTADVVNWINSGFKGNPAFISNPTGFFLDVADQATGAFIANSGPLSSLCAPFNLDIRLNLALNSTQPVRQRYACTLSTIINNAENARVSVGGTVTQNGSVIASGGVSAGGTGSNNINGFMNGDFSQGGWPAFIAMTTEPQNNYYGARMQAETDLSIQINNRQASIKSDALAGGGFMSYQKCDDLGTIVADNVDPYAEDDIPGVNNPNTTTRVNSDGSITYQLCHTETPGSTISAALNKQLGSGGDSLVAADEFDEVLSAAFGQLLKTVLTGGLYSSSQSGSGGTQAITTVLRNDSTGTPIQTIITNLANSIDQYMPDTQLYKSVRDRTVTAITDEQTYANTVYSSCVANSWQSYADNVQGITTNQISPLLTQYQTKAADAAARVKTLTDIQTAINSPDAQDPSKLNALGIQFSNLLSAGTITTTIDVNNANTDLTSVQGSASTIHSSIAQYDMLCHQSHH